MMHVCVSTDLFLLVQSHLQLLHLSEQRLQLALLGIFLLLHQLLCCPVDRLLVLLHPGLLLLHQSHGLRMVVGWYPWLRHIVRCMQATMPARTHASSCLTCNALRFNKTCPLAL